MFKGNQYYLQKVDTDFHFVETCAPYKIRDDDGMLRYTKVKTSDDEVVDVSHRLDGTAYPEFLEGLDYVDETTEEKTYRNNQFDKYQQFRFDFRRTSYYIDNDGYLTVSFSDYDYTVGPK